MQGNDETKIETEENKNEREIRSSYISHLYSLNVTQNKHVHITHRAWHIDFSMYTRYTHIMNLCACFSLVLLSSHTTCFFIENAFVCLPELYTLLWLDLYTSTMQKMKTMHAY